MTAAIVALIVLSYGIMAFHRCTLPIWSALSGALTLMVIALGCPNAMVATLAVLTLGFGAFSIGSLRRKVLTQFIFRWFKKALPVLSKTEQEALDAGTVWWDAELFSGAPDWSHLLETPPPTLTSDEQAFIDGPVNELLSQLDEWQIHESKDLPPHVWEFLKENKFFSMIIPKAYGGLGFTALGNSEVVMRIASRNLTAAVTVMVPNSLGPGELLTEYGTQTQRNHYLPRLARGDDIPCFALTGPAAGSDAGSMPDHGIVTYGEWEGKTVLGFRLNWNKRYITLAPVATLLGLAFKAQDPDGLLGSELELGITCALIPTDLPGVEIGARHLPSGASFMNGPTRGHDVFIPFEQVIGGQERIGQGWSMLVQSLAAGRAISLPALGVAGTKVCAQLTGSYARIRKQFKTSIGHFEGVQEPLTRMAALTYRLDATRTLTVCALDLGEKPSVLTAIAKCYITEGNRSAVNDAMDVHGGKGIMQGPNNYLNLMYQALPIGITVEGANILTRSMIIFGQGAIRAHPYILKEMKAVAEPDANVGLIKFDSAFFSHIGFTITNVVRTLTFGLSAARFVSSPVKGPVSRYYRELTRMSTAFALTSDFVLIVLGGAFKVHERLSGRLADVLGHLYMISAMLKKYEDDGQPESDTPILEWAIDDSLYIVQSQLAGVLHNFPLPWLGRVLQRLVFPLGSSYRAPSDVLGRRVADLLLTHNDARRRLLSGVYSSHSDDATGRINLAFASVLASAQIERKVQMHYRVELSFENIHEVTTRAVADGLLSTAEAEELIATQNLVRAAIDVDHFPAEYFDRQTVQDPKVLNTISNGERLERAVS